MRIDDGHLDTLFRKVFQVQEEVRLYCLGGDSHTVSIDDLTSAITRMYDCPITRSEIRGLPVRHVDSFLLRYEKHCEIIVNRSLPDADFRFACTKELSHILLDEREDWSTDGVRTIETLVQDNELEIFLDGKHEPDAGMVWEHLALFAAAEFLYPRFQLRKDHEDLIKGTISIEDIAKKRRLPISRVKLVHNATNYESFEQAYKRVFEHHSA